MRLSPLTLILDMLACYRLAWLLSEDSITEPLRAWLSRRWKWAGRGIDCTFCTSVWCGFGIVAWEQWAPRPWSYIALGLALSAVACILAVLTMKAQD